MKKIGITTYWDTHTNYGQLLQGYALQNILYKNGFSPYTIKYTLKEENIFYSKIINRLKNGFNWRKLITGQYFIKTKQVITKQKNDLNRERNFDNFRSLLSFSEKEYDSFNQIKNKPPKADIYITGSDQVWASWIRTKTKRIFLLDFGGKNTKKIAYGASFARDNLKKNERKLYRRCLKKYTFIGVRESSGIEICNSLGITNCKLVADPTILLTKNEWLSLVKPNKEIENKEYIFAYMVDNPIDNQNILIGLEYIKSKKTPFYYVSSALYEDENSNFRPPVEEWINYVNNAKFIITSSYHGVIFCLLLNKPFLAIAKPHSHKQNSRLVSLLELVNLTNLLIDKNITIEKLDNLLEQDINWNFVNETLDKIRTESLSYLLNALNS